jgi:hypothetical protein
MAEAGTMEIYFQAMGAIAEKKIPFCFPIDCSLSEISIAEIFSKTIDKKVYLYYPKEGTKMKIEQQVLLAISYGKPYKELGYSIDEKFGLELENAKEESKKGGHAK